MISSDDVMTIEEVIEMVIGTALVTEIEIIEVNFKFGFPQKYKNSKIRVFLFFMIH